MMSAVADSPAPRVLVVDDEPSIRAFVLRALTYAGYGVVAASGGSEALQLVEAQPPFDLFVVDMAMPQMSGDELARQLRRRHPDVKVLYCTGYSERLFESRKVLWQHEAFIEKPVSVGGLLEAVSLLLFGHINGPSVDRQPGLVPVNQPRPRPHLVKDMNLR